MRVAFLGTSDFSVPSLRALAERGDEVVVVVTQPDRPGDRGRPAPRPVAELARDLGLPVLQPPRLRDPEATAALLAAEPAALVVAAYGQILPASLLDAVPLGGINVHASVLPRWRGAAPIAAAVLHGDGSSGVSIMRMDAGLDTGPVYATRGVAIGERETAPELSRRLAELGARTLVEVLADVEAGRAVPVPQDPSAATLAPRLRREDGLVDWSRHGAVTVDRMVRALEPWPGVHASLAGREVRLVRGAPEPGAEADAEASAAPDAEANAAPEAEANAAPDAEHSAEPCADHYAVPQRHPGVARRGVRPGELIGIGRSAVFVSTASGIYRLDVLQPPGRTPMPAAAWLRGRRDVDAGALPRR